MADYWGAAAIAARMGVTRDTLRRWYLERGFLMMRRRQRTRTTWYTNDLLIVSWEAEQCRQQAAQARAASIARRPGQPLTTRKTSAQGGGTEP